MQCSAVQFKFDREQWQAVAVGAIQMEAATLSAVQLTVGVQLRRLQLPPPWEDRPGSCVHVIHQALVDALSQDVPIAPPPRCLPARPTVLGLAPYHTNSDCVARGSKGGRRSAHTQGRKGGILTVSRCSGWRECASFKIKEGEVCEGGGSMLEEVLEPKGILARDGRSQTPRITNRAAAAIDF